MEDVEAQTEAVEAERLAEAEAVEAQTEAMEAQTEAERLAEAEAVEAQTEAVEAQTEAVEAQTEAVEAERLAEAEAAGAGAEHRAERVQLAAYYVLGDTAETEALPLPDACLRLVVLVHPQELEHDVVQHERDASVIIYARLFDAAAGMRVDAARDAGDARAAGSMVVEHLVREAMPTEAAARAPETQTRRPGAKRGAVWG